MLRRQVLAASDTYDQLVEASRGSLVLSDLSIGRAVALETPQLTTQLNFHMRFQNEGDTRIEYSIQELYVTIGQTREPIAVNSSAYEIWPHGSSGYLFSMDIPPTSDEAFEVSLEYIVWYGPITTPDRYEQHYTYVIRNSIVVDQPNRTTDRFWRHSGQDMHRILDAAEPPIHIGRTRDIDVQVFVKSGVWKKPPRAVRAEVVVRGAGAGSSITDGKISPGNEGEVTVKEIRASDLPETAQVQIGDGGPAALLGCLQGPKGHRGYAVVINHLGHG